MKVIEGPALPGWENHVFSGSFRSGDAVMGWAIYGPLFIAHSWESNGATAHDGLRLCAAIRKKARAFGFSKVNFQINPETGFAMMRVVESGKANLEYIMCSVRV